MNEEQLIEFINWLPSIVPEFKDATPDQIVQTLNQMSESDEGQQMLSQLINTFQQAKQSADSQMFKKGGKMSAFVSKYGNGGCVSCKKKAILQGGMVNKVAEKMQDGGALKSSEESSPREFNITIPILSRKDLKQQTNAANFVNRAQEGLIGENRLNKLLPKNLAIINAIPVNQKGGELATMTSAETANNVGLIPKAQEGLSMQPQVKPSGILGWFWDPEFIGRVDSGADVGERWTGKRTTYYEPNGNLVQILTKEFPAGNTSRTTRTIKYPFTPIADTTTVVFNGSSGNKVKVPNSRFNKTFDLNFNKSKNE